jgi:hypothetical protein
MRLIERGKTKHNRNCNANRFVTNRFVSVATCNRKKTINGLRKSQAVHSVHVADFQKSDLILYEW